MPCRGVGLGVGKVQFRPIIRIVSIRVMSLDVICLIIASLAWNNGNDKHVDYFSVSIFNGVILDQCGLCQMPLD